LPILNWRPNHWLDRNRAGQTLSQTESQGPGDSFLSHFNRGLAHYQAGRLGDATAEFRAAVAVQPGRPVAVYNLGIALADLGEREAAAKMLSEALRLRPDHPQTLFRLGGLLLGLDQAAAAVSMFRRLMRLQPGFPDAAFMLGNALMALDAPEQAQSAYRLAHALDPGRASIANNLGGSVMACVRPAEAVPHYRRAIQLDPDVPEYHKNLGTCLLTLGDFAEGWPAYEWRHRQANWRWKRSFPGVPAWDGGPLVGKTILVHFEQGLGDTVQFIRYLPLLQRMGARTIFECQPQLRDVLTGMRGVDILVCHGDPLPPFDVHVPLMSLPLHCRTTVATIPADRYDGLPCLLPSPARVAFWRERIPASGFKVGINWQAAGANRSIPLEHFAPLAALPGVQLFSLQQRAGLEQLDRLGRTLGIVSWPDAERDTGFSSFVDSAAIIASLDLVISCDSAMIHLAGALGKSAFLLLPWLGDWRWMQNRESTPWYESVRLFRMQSRNDWAGVMRRVADEIA
jgi:Flp pilus assembly protein TadD